jgi:uncharacterized protein YceH (UPF0502 family)
MELELEATEVRVLGCLVEKEMTTPDYYPLSLSALTSACNQKSSRHPVVSYDEKTAARALESLKAKQLAYSVSGGRVPKYGHNVLNVLNLIKREVAVLCVLMLRGPQTSGELRGRTERMYGFEGLDEVRETLANLEDMRLVCELPRSPGRKENRYAHLLSGEMEIQDEKPEAGLEPATLEVRAENKRMDMIEEEIASLRRELEDFKKRFLDFKAQFE